MAAFFDVIVAYCVICSTSKASLLGNIFPDRKFFTIQFGKERLYSEAIVPENGIIKLMDRNPFECYRFDPTHLPKPGFKAVHCSTLMDSADHGYVLSVERMGNILKQKDLVLPPLAVTKTRRLATKLDKRSIYVRVYPRETYKIIPNDKVSFYLKSMDVSGSMTSWTMIPQHGVIKLSYLSDPLCVIYDAHSADEAVFVESIPSEDPHKRSFTPFKEVDCDTLTSNTAPSSSMTVGSMELYMNSGLLTKPKEYIPKLTRNEIVIDVKKKPPDLPTPCKIGFGTNALLTRPNHLDKFIHLHGDETVDEIIICKQPVSKGIAMVLDLLTHYKFSEVKKMYHYDEVYHLYAVIKLNGKQYRIEKNENVMLTSFVPDAAHDAQFAHDLKQKLGELRNLISLGSCKEVKDAELSTKKRTFKEIIEKAEEENKCLYYYNPWRSNCQDFISEFTKHIGLQPDIFHAYDAYIRQDEMKKIFQRQTVKNIALGLTDVAAMVNRIIHIAADETPVNHMYTLDDEQASKSQEALLRDILVLARKIQRKYNMLGVH